MPDRRIGLGDGVVVRGSPLAPAVEDAQHERIGSGAGKHRTPRKCRWPIYAKPKRSEQRSRAALPDFQRALLRRPTTHQIVALAFEGRRVYSKSAAKRLL